MQMEGKRSYEHGVRSRHSPKTGWKELLCREVFAGHGKMTCSTLHAPRSTLHEREEDWLPASCARLPRGAGFPCNGQP